MFSRHRIKNLTFCSAGFVQEALLACNYHRAMQWRETNNSTREHFKEILGNEEFQREEITKVEGTRRFLEEAEMCRREERLSFAFVLISDPQWTENGVI